MSDTVQRLYAVKFQVVLLAIKCTRVPLINFVWLNPIDSISFLAKFPLLQINTPFRRGSSVLKVVVPVPVEVEVARKVYSNPAVGDGRVNAIALLLVVWVMPMIQQ
mgnify:CR=1 FL=1